MIELKDTVSYMVSESHKKRVVAEYTQTKLRYIKLKQAIIKYESGELPYTLPSPELCKDQCIAMERYLSIIEARANIEGIDVNILLQSGTFSDSVVSHLTYSFLKDSYN